MLKVTELAVYSIIEGKDLPRHELDYTGNLHHNIRLHIGPNNTKVLHFPEGSGLLDQMIYFVDQFFVDLEGNTFGFELGENYRIRHNDIPKFNSLFANSSFTPRHVYPISGYYPRARDDLEGTLLEFSETPPDLSVYKQERVLQVNSGYLIAEI